jgi:hypothetical protein
MRSPIAAVVLGCQVAGVLPLLAAPAGPPKVSVSLAFIEPSGKTLAEKQIEAIIGSETATDVRDRNRTIKVKTTVRVAQKPDCYLTEIAVHDQDIDPGGRFSKTEWSTRGEVCRGFTITLGPRNETRVRIGVLRPR